MKKRKTVRKKPFQLRGGPFHGAVVWLASGSTLDIRVGRDVGRYKLDRYTDEDDVLHWKPDDGMRT